MELDKLAPALVKFQASVPVIAKNQTAKIVMKGGGSYSYSYADLSDIWEAIRKPLETCGLAVTQLLGDLNGSDAIYTKIWHVSGQTEVQAFRIPTGGKTPQEVGSVITYYKRYALSDALGISTEEDDDGSLGNQKPAVVESSAVVLARAKKAINSKLEERGYQEARSKMLFIQGVLEKQTISNLDEADLVMTALENEA